MFQILLMTFSITFFLVLFLEGAGLRFGFVDRPGGRKMQTVCIPRCGGAAFAVAIAVVASIFYFKVNWRWAELVGAAIVFSGGVYDDLRRQNSVLVKVLFQIVAIGIFCIWVDVPQPLSRLESVLLHTSIFFFVWGMVNSFNLMDNVNGLASGLSLVLLMGFGYLSWRSSGEVLFPFIVASAVFAFFIRNFFSGKIFMGDQGSQLLGYMTGVIAVEFLLRSYLQWNELRLLKFLLLLTIFFFPFVLDTTLVVVIRWFKKRPLYIGDQNHLSHQLIRFGLSSSQATLLLIAFQMLFFLLGFWSLSVL